VRFARLIDRPVRVLGGPAVRAACGGNLSLPWLPLTVMPYECTSLRTRQGSPIRPGYLTCVM
jgi:hypothetical protein